MSQAGFWIGNTERIDLKNVHLRNVKGELFQVYDSEAVALPKDK